MATTRPTQLLDMALNALRARDDWRSVLDEFPIPVYTTDADGAVTYWNRACADMAGRELELGKDRWCVTWRLYTTSGEPLPHDQCPMARAIKERREIHDEIVIAERPDGRRCACRVYPTPWFDEKGKLEGAVNLLIDVTKEQVGALSDQAARCRRLARATTDVQAANILATMATDFAATAATLRAGE